MTPLQVTAQDTEIARAILDRVLLHQRRSPVGKQCADSPCVHCADAHVDSVAQYVAANRPVEFVLPAFPTKSPNPAKVLGVAPDKAEELALGFLAELCRDIAKIHAPGAKVIICSDGRVFGQLIKVPDSSITTYQHGMRDMVDQIDPDSLSLFNLDDVCPEHSHDQMREEIDLKYGECFEDLRAEIKKDDNDLAMYRGIVRFLVEDLWNDGFEGTRSALQRDCRKRAYAVVGRSRAWGALLADHFPDAVRLSIHPQPCGSAKIGILLAATDDVWLTPWHSVAVEQNGNFTLMKRVDAERAGAALVEVDGVPSHYSMPQVRTSYVASYLPELLCVQ